MANTKKIINAQASFEQGFNCAQAVFSIYAEDLGLTAEQAKKISSSFGGGINSRGEVCGAVTGGLMAIGLKYGYTDPKQLAAKEFNKNISTEFIRQIEAQFDTILCREIKDENPKDIYKNCPLIVEASAKILKDLLD